MTDGGRLGVKTHTLEQNVLVEISDTGQGISPEHLSNLFRPYFTTKKKGRAWPGGFLQTRSRSQRRYPSEFRGQSRDPGGRPASAPGLSWVTFEIRFRIRTTGTGQAPEARKCGQDLQD